jgi:hypothetical protein
MAFVADWTVNFTVAKVDVTALGDTNLVWVAGLPDASGDFSGFYDTATASTYSAAVDGQPRNFYLYPSLLGVQGAAPGQYFFGTILPDWSVSGCRVVQEHLERRLAGPAVPGCRYPRYLIDSKGRAACKRLALCPISPDRPSCRVNLSRDRGNTRCLLAHHLPIAGLATLVLPLRSSRLPTRTPVSARAPVRL